MSMLIGIIAVIIFLSILILVHELGHFLTAKKFGLLVEEFGFGLPPRIWAKKIGETIYSINVLPFGGFVKIYGEDGAETDKNGTLIEEISTVEIEEKIVDAKNRIEIDEKLVMAEKVIISDSNKARSFVSLPISKRAIIILAGVLMNFLLGWLLISVIFYIGIPKAILITGIEPNSPAAGIGLQVGDKIAGAKMGPKELGGAEIGADNFIKFINEYRGQEITIKIERNGEIKEFKAIPRINPPAGQGALGTALMESGLAKKDLLVSAWEGLKTSLEIVQAVFVAIFTLIAKVFIGKANLEQIAGPVGIVKVTAQAGTLGFAYLLQLLALISLNLVVINIFPFPALDGGRLLFLLIEKIKGSPLPVKFEKYANGFGMILLILLMIAITVKDVIRFY